MSDTSKEIKESFNIIVGAITSINDFRRKSPNGKESNRELTIGLALSMERGRFEEDGKFSGLPLYKFAKDLTTVSTTKKIYNTTLLHVAIDSGMPRALNFALNIARERDELEKALMSTNQDNITPMENIERRIKEHNNQASQTKNDAYIQGLKTCKEIIQNTHQHLIYKRRWDKKPNTGKMLA